MLILKSSPKPVAQFDDADLNARYMASMREAKGIPDSIFFCTNRGNAAKMHEVLFEDAQDARLSTRFNTFGLYQKPLLEALERDLIMTTQIIFHDARQMDFSAVDTALLKQIQPGGRVEVFTFAGKGNLDDLLIAQSQSGKIHLRLQAPPQPGEDMANALAILHASEERRANMIDYFARLRAASRPYFAP